MEHQYFHVLLHPSFGIILSLLVGITNCKYITEAYFQKYDTLTDQVFQDFISNDLSHGFCATLQTKHNFSPKLSVLKRQLIGEGSHRRLTSSIRIENLPEVSSKLPLLSCEAIIVETLPSGVFADPFELHHLTQHGVFTDASAFGDTDLELPTARANRSVVEIHMDMGPKNGWELKIELPLHARYAPLGKHGYTKVEFGSPDLFLCCVVERDSYNESCIFSSNNDGVRDDGVRANSAAIVWEVPSGTVKHTKLVSVLTFISAVVGALSIFAACVFYSEISVYNDSKQS